MSAETLTPAKALRQIRGRFRWVHVKQGAEIVRRKAFRGATCYLVPRGRSWANWMDANAIRTHGRVVPADATRQRVAEELATWARCVEHADGETMEHYDDLPHWRGVDLRMASAAARAQPARTETIHLSK